MLVRVIVHSRFATWFRRLESYFASGWAFLVPYVIAYLLYYFCRWPALPSSPHALGRGGHVPALLHVYWSLHAMHLVLAALIAGNRWRGNLSGVPDRRRTALAARRVVPWLLLAITLATPGLYLEWPADPWEHLSRVTEWSALETVGVNYARGKALYFLAYSIVGRLPTNYLLFGAHAYATTVSLLVSWQYFRLGRTLGLSPAASWVFVVVNTLVFGNACFSFYRYYGLATTAFAQLGATALVGIAVKEFAQPVGGRRFASVRYALRQLPVVTGLLLLITFNHAQGLAIAGVSCASVALWWLSHSRTSMIYFGLSVLLAANIAAVVLLSGSPAVVLAQSGGWTSPWLGFAVFAPASPAATRAAEILGFAGVIDLAAGVALVARASVTGWLAVGPTIFISMPLFALPFIEFVTAAYPAGDHLSTFNRLCLAIPSGLATTVLIANVLGRRRAAEAGAFRHVGFALLCAVLVVVVLVPPGRPSFNRVWQRLAAAPADLALAPVWSANASAPQRLIPQVVAPAGVAYVAEVQDPAQLVALHRIFSGPQPHLAQLQSIASALKNSSSEHLLLLCRPTAFVSPQSLAARFSGHWPAQQAQLAAAGTAEGSQAIAAGQPEFTAEPLLRVSPRRPPLRW